MSTRVAQACDELQEVLSDPDLLNQVRDVRRSLAAPLRVAIVGPTGSGKSTLVNALLGRKVARTDGSSVTRLVVTYRYGSPERIIVHSAAGTPSTAPPLSDDGRVPGQLAVDGAVIAPVTVELPCETLRCLDIVDTPGSVPSTDPTHSTGSLFGIDQRAIAVIAASHVIVVLLPAASRLLDRTALRSFRHLASAWRCSAANTMILLGHADLRASGAERHLGSRTGVQPSDDPLAAVDELADVLAGQLWPAVADVLPVSALWAETASSPSSPEQETPALRRMSRIRPVTDILLGDFASRGDLLRSSSAINRLADLALGAAGSAVRQFVEDLHLDPVLLRLSAMSALQLLTSGEVILSTDLVQDVVRMATKISPWARMGSSAQTAPSDLARTAAGRSRQWHALAHAQPRVFVDQERVAWYMYRSYAALRAQLEKRYL